MPCPSLSAAGLAGELPVLLLPEPALRSRCGRGIFRVGCGFPYPVVSIALQRPKEKEHLLDTEQATGYFYKRPLVRVLKERAAGAWGSAGVLPGPWNVQTGMAGANLLPAFPLLRTGSDVHIPRQGGVGRHLPQQEKLPAQFPAENPACKKKEPHICAEPHHF